MEKKQQLDIFDFAIGLEKDGMNFYSKAAEKFPSEDLKKLFVDLAKAEATHIQTFMDLKAKAEKKGAVQLFSIPNVNEYLEALIQDGLFPKGEEAAQRLEKIDTVVAACVMAMQAEKNAILLYSELGQLSKDAKQGKAFENLAKEEKSHTVMVKNLRADHDPAYAALAFGRFF
jgi:rubrerythrin